MTRKVEKLVMPAGNGQSKQARTPLQRSQFREDKLLQVPVLLEFHWKRKLQTGKGLRNFQMLSKSCRVKRSPLWLFRLLRLGSHGRTETPPVAGLPESRKGQQHIVLDRRKERKLHSYRCAKAARRTNQATTATISCAGNAAPIETASSTGEKREEGLETGSLWEGYLRPLTNFAQVFVMLHHQFNPKIAGDFPSNIGGL